MMLMQSREISENAFNALLNLIFNKIHDTLNLFSHLKNKFLKLIKQTSTQREKYKTG